MIASNYRKHPDAMALQLPLPLPHRLVWQTTRPGSRILRAIRAARTKAFQAAGRIAWPQPAATPQWWKDAKDQARSLARQVKAACLVLWAEVRVADTDPPRLVDFKYEQDLQQALTNGNRYRARVLRMELQRTRMACPACG